jgi:hypothetical protein
MDDVVSELSPPPWVRGLKPPQEAITAIFKEIQRTKAHIHEDRFVLEAVIAERFAAAAAKKVAETVEQAS